MLDLNLAAARRQREEKKKRGPAYPVSILHQDYGTWKSLRVCLSTPKGCYVICYVGDEKDWMACVALKGSCFRQLRDACSVGPSSNHQTSILPAHSNARILTAFPP